METTAKINIHLHGRCAGEISRRQKRRDNGRATNERVYFHNFCFTGLYLICFLLLRGLAQPFAFNAVESLPNHCLFAPIIVFSRQMPVFASLVRKCASS
jgi:hypothetical protein